MKLAFSICTSALLLTAAARPLVVGPLGSGDEMREERESRRRSLVWRLAVGADGAPKSLTATDDNAALFAAAAKSPPSAWFGRDWNLVRISARGLSAAYEAVRVHVGRIGLEIRVR